jgi:hypothetical protein
VDGPVPADCDEEVGVGGGLARELGQVPRALREQRIAAQPERRGPVRELRPAPSGGAVLGSGVDEERDSLNGIR